VETGVEGSVEGWVTLGGTPASAVKRGPGLSATGAVACEIAEAGAGTEDDVEDDVEGGMEGGVDDGVGAAAVRVADDGVFAPAKPPSRLGGCTGARATSHAAFT
jgi:hypothetical protein